VAITPASGFVGVTGAIVIGIVAGVVCFWSATWLKTKLGYDDSLDDSLDVVAAHGVGGTVGALLTGIFAEKSWNGVSDGALFGNPKQLLIQAVAVIAVMIYSGVVSFILLKLIGLVTPLRATADDETVGLDISLHGEEAYLHE